MGRNIILSINGKQVSAPEGVTVIEAARAIGIDIPTLCYLSDYPPVGACRVCVVEVEGSRTLVASCHTPIAEGMVVLTHSPKVIETRKILVELMLASHPDACLVCDKANACELRRLATDLDIGLPRFRLTKHYYPIETANQGLVRDMSKCILCRRCVTACQNAEGDRLFGVAYRGFDSKVVHGLDGSLDVAACGDWDACVAVCPTGALARPSKAEETKRRTVLFIKGP